MWTKQRAQLVGQVVSLTYSKKIRNLGMGQKAGEICPLLILDYLLRDSCSPEVQQMLFESFAEVAERIEKGEF